jgi:HD-GYP domain-containing protein (c-di-GMP phosphodiesterase class II)/DNA-binding CsgD family transcriptional regulator
VADVRLAELCAATSLFTDLGTGQPQEHALRTCLAAMRLADALDLDEAECQSVYYVSLLRFLGCTAGVFEADFMAGMAPVTMGSAREELTRLVGLVARGEPLPTRLRSLARTLADPGAKSRVLGAHCEVAARLAARMGLPAGVADALRFAYARWDGRGVPQGVSGEQIPVAMRVAIVARDVELWARDAGAAATMEMLRARSGRAYPPQVVDVVLALGVEDLRRCDTAEVWDSVVAGEPPPVHEVDDTQLAEVLGALGDFADLKHPLVVGHSRRVARLAAAAGAELGFDVDRVRTLERAGLVHDVGMVSVPTVGSTADAAWEQVRLHPLWTQRILVRCRGLSSVADIAGRHHERLDGTGYPGGLTAASLGVEAGLLACCVEFAALTSAGADHEALDRDAAAIELATLADNGALARRDVDAVLAAAGMPATKPRALQPAGLTEREVEVLRLLAHGSTNRQIAAALWISPKTVGAHIEHIYAKADVSSRAAATVFAMENDLLAPRIG